MSTVHKVKSIQDNKIYYARKTIATIRLQTNTGPKLIFPGDWLVEDDLGNTTFCREYLFDKLYQLVL